MKTFFLLSDVNMGLIIGGVITAVVTPFMALVISYLNKVIAKQDLIHTQMDGMKGELVEATAALNEAIGKAKGREELKQEQKEVAVTAPATEVVVVENKDKEVIIKENRDKSVGL